MSELLPPKPPGLGNLRPITGVDSIISINYWKFKRLVRRRILTLIIQIFNNFFIKIYFNLLNFIKLQSFNITNLSLKIKIKLITRLDQFYKRKIIFIKKKEF